MCQIYHGRNSRQPFAVDNDPAFAPPVQERYTRFEFHFKFRAFAVRPTSFDMEEDKDERKSRRCEASQALTCVNRTVASAPPQRHGCAISDTIVVGAKDRMAPPTDHCSPQFSCPTLHIHLRRPWHQILAKAIDIRPQNWKRYSGGSALHHPVMGSAIPGHGVSCAAQSRTGLWSVKGQDFHKRLWGYPPMSMAQGHDSYFQLEGGGA